MAYNIGPRIGIEGESEFRRKIKDINAEYKTLEAETRAVTAAFDANGDEQGKLEATSRQLEKQIDAQKRKMSLLEDALSKASSKYDENSIEAIRLRGALYDTQATVSSLESELRDTNQRISESGAAMSDAESEAAQLAEAESRLKSQISDVDAEYKAIVAETKALVASYGKTENQTDHLRISSQQLEKQIDSQRKKIDLLEAAVETAAKKYGDNSSEANKLRASLYDTQATVSSLESELQDTNQRLNDAAEGMEEFREETEDAGDTALDFKDIVGANFISDVAIDLLHEIGDAVAEFAKGMPEAAAEVNAANSQFEQTFGELEGRAKAVLQSISDETNIAVTRMQGDYTKLYAFTKTAGADSETALDISGRAMRAAADNAAYYDKSIEEATEQLQSFLKGNYENDAALGIAATETTRNAKANEMYAKSFNDLSEAQKIDVLLAMVEAGNEASGAMGQAAREADSWTNVQGELNEAIKQLQADLGQPILKMAVPLFQDITDAIYEMIEKPDWAVLESGIDGFVESMEAAEVRYNSSRAEAEASAYMAEQYVMRLEALEAAGLDTAESQREYENIVRHLNELYPELNLHVDENTGLVIENKNAILSNIDAMKQKAVYAAMEDRYTAALKAQAEATLAVGEAEYELIGIGSQRELLEKQLADATGMTADQLVQMYRNQMLVNGAMADSKAVADGMTLGMTLMGEATGSLTDEQMEQVALLIQLQTEEGRLNQTITEGKATIASYDEEILGLNETLAQITDTTGAVTEAEDHFSLKIQEVEQNLANLKQEYSDAKTEAQASIESQIGLFDQLSIESEMSTADIIANWKQQQEAFANYSANLQKAIDMKLDQSLIDQLSDGSTESMAILNELVNDTEINIDEINAAFQERMQAEELVTDAMAEARTGAQAEMDTLVEAANQWGYDIVDGAVVSINANAYRFQNAMSGLAAGGERAFRETMVMHSPSRLMIADNEDVVAGAVIGIERNIANYEAAMEELGSAGYLAYLNKRIDLAEDYPNMMDSVVMQANSRTTSSVDYGGFVFQIYQQPGEDARDLAYRVMDVMQMELQSKEVSIGANQ